MKDKRPATVGRMVEAEDFAEVAPGLFHWCGYDSALKCDLSSTAIRTEQGLVIVDPISLRRAALAKLIDQGPVRAILLTSGNHERAAAVFRADLGAPIVAPRYSQGYLQCTADALVGEGQFTPGDLCAVAVPSAGPGEVAYVGSQVVILGDAVINFGSHGFSLLPDKYCADPRQLPNDLRKLLSYEFRILTFAHGDPALEHARERFEQLLA